MCRPIQTLQGPAHRVGPRRNVSGDAIHIQFLMVKFNHCLVYVNVYRFAVNVYGLPKTSARTLRRPRMRGRR
jgi:hypothetical protein